MPYGRLWQPFFVTATGRKILPTYLPTYLPTRRGLFDIATCVNEEVLYREHMKFAKDRLTQLERLNQKSKIHYGAKSNAGLMTLICVENAAKERFLLHKSPKSIGHDSGR
jgi:hypothetical protein